MTRLFLLLCLLFVLAVPLAHAEKADKQKPIEIDADRIHVDDRQKVHVFEGNVLMKQGTLEIRGDRVVVTQDEQGFKTGVATAQGGRLATFRPGRRVRRRLRVRPRCRHFNRRWRGVACRVGRTGGECRQPEDRDREQREDERRHRAVPSGEVPG